MQTLVANVLGVELRRHNSGHAFPFAEDDNLGRAAVQSVAKNVHQFGDFHVVAVLSVLVDNISAVCQHTHLSKHEQQSSSFFFAQTACPLPFAHQFRYRIL